MAINYTDLFEDIGEFLQRINQFRTLAVTTLPAYFGEIAAELSGNGRYDVLSNLPQQYDGYKDQMIQIANDHDQKIQERLQNQDTILEQLPLPTGAGIQDILHELIRNMISATASITASVVTIGSVTADGGNAGAVTVLTTKILDGVQAPLSGAEPDYNYAGLDSQLGTTAETLVLTCVSDSERDSVTPGSESFQIEGQQQGNSPFDWRVEGSGIGPTITPVQGSGFLPNGDFEDFTVANTPDSWTIDAGVAGTHIFEETTGADVKKGSSAIRFTGNAALASIQISQGSDTLGQLVPLQLYGFAIWVKGNASISAGTLTIQFEGTGYTAGASEKITMNAAALAAATGYTLKNFFVLMPESLPDDFKLVIKWNGTPSAHSVRLDYGGLAPVNYHGGIGLILVDGAANSIRNDRYSFDVSNDNAGVFQTYFRKALRRQLPTSGSPSIADSLAT